jgi:hypothetical protein
MIGQRVCMCVNNIGYGSPISLPVVLNFRIIDIFAQRNAIANAVKVSKFCAFCHETNLLSLSENEIIVTALFWVSYLLYS